MSTRKARTPSGLPRLSERSSRKASTGPMPNRRWQSWASRSIPSATRRSAPREAPPRSRRRFGLTRSQRIGIQQQLTSIGYATGVADGLWGQNTRTAISRWQTANRVSATGYLTPGRSRRSRSKPDPTVGTDPGPTPVANDQLEERLLGLTASERREIQTRLTRLGYSTYGADGVFGSNTRRALATWQRDEGLRASGYITADQVRQLRRQTGG